MRLLPLALALPCLSVMLFAQQTLEVSRSAELHELAATIQSELEAHGQRVLGHETYRWNTRLERIEGCRAELTIRVTSNLKDTVVNTESVSFLFGGLEAYSMEAQKSWLDLPCAGQEKCFVSTATCTRTTRDGIAIDCTTSNQKRVNSLALQLDGDPGATQRLLRAFRQAVQLCREPARVAF